LDRLGVRLSLRLVVDAPAGVMTHEVIDALATHKPALLVLLARVDDRTEPGPPPADRRWRAAVARWPVDWRERWGRRANEVESAGATWIEAEWSAYGELAPDLADAERRGEVVCTDPAPGLSDSEAVAAIDRAFGALAPARRSDRGPRDVRHGERWLPWHAQPGRERGR
jgi:hypothetical protein